MICAAISANDTESAIQKSQKAIKQGATFIEVRIDYFKNPFAANFPKLVKNIASKLIITIRKPDEGGKYAFDENERQELIKKAILAAPYGIDIEFSMDTADLTQLIQLAKENQVKIILSSHDFQKTPELSQMKNQILEAANKGVDFVKIIGTASSLEDNLKMLSLPQIAKKNKIQIIAFTMGSKGAISRILSPIFGAAFTFAALDEPTAPGQLSIIELKKTLETFSSYTKKGE